MTLRIRFEDFGTDDPILTDIYTLRVLARNLTVEINDYTEADTFTCEIDYKSFPFDPRNIRSCGVTIHVEDREKIFSGNSLDLLQPRESNTLFTGFADEESIAFNDDSRVVTMEGRDFTALFLDEKRINTTPIPLARPVNEIIQTLINEQQATKELEVELRLGTQTDLPTLSQLAPDFNPVTANRNPKRNETYWDIIQSIAEKAGLIVFVELSKVILSKPQALYNRENTIQCIYGYNLKTLNFRRKLGRQRGFNIKVVSLNIEEKRTVEAKLPEEAKDSEFISRFGNTRITIEQLDKDGKKIEPPKDADFLTFRVADIASKDHLIVVGEKIYEELSRQEIEGSLMTREMAMPRAAKKSSTGQVLKADVVSFNTIRNGTPIEVIMEQDDLNKIKTISSLAERRKYLIRQGYQPEIAEAFAQTMNKQHHIFYTKSVKFQVGQDDGFQMDIDFINFIELDNSTLGF